LKRRTRPSARNPCEQIIMCMREAEGEDVSTCGRSRADKQESR